MIRDFEARIFLLVAFSPFGMASVYTAIPLLIWLHGVLVDPSHRGFMQPLSEFIIYCVLGAFLGIPCMVPIMAMYRTDWRISIPLVYGGAATCTFAYICLYPSCQSDGTLLLFPFVIVVVLILTLAAIWRIFFPPAKRGQCPACGYPIGTSPVCTECGKPVTPRRVKVVA